ncbi:MAG: class I SAM-dependent methyltransferase [Chloroflexi bacterium]|nr:class I SAM-dependent methyltransferase [Chloroflexota bacterium]
MLEIGAGDGHVADALRRATGAYLTLVDVVDYNRTPLKLHTYDGQNLPFADRSFDYSLLVFVLHHTPDPLIVLREALRVARDGVVIVENHVEGRLRRPFTRAIDSIPHFRWGVPVCHHTNTAIQWSTLFARAGVHVEELSRFEMNGGFWQNVVLRLTP